MLAAHWLDEWLSSNAEIFLSLGVIIVCITLSIILSMAKNKREAAKKQTL